MGFVKICPHCRHKNDTFEAECTNCFGDLSVVPPVDESLVKEIPAKQEPSNTEQPKMAENPTNNEEKGEQKVPAKHCECGWYNEANLKFCSKCQRNIKGLAKIYVFQRILDDQKKQAKNDEPKPEAKVEDHKLDFGFSLATVDGSYSYSLSLQNPIVVVGREQEMAEYLHNKQYVSRTHAQLQIVGAKVAIKDVGSSNGTFVNYKRLSPNVDQLLEEGAKVSFGGPWNEEQQDQNVAYFVVHY